MAGKEKNQHSLASKVSCGNFLSQLLEKINEIFRHGPIKLHNASACVGLAFSKRRNLRGKLFLQSK